jgi:hypothetical protein
VANAKMRIAVPRAITPNPQNYKANAEFPAPVLTQIKPWLQISITLLPRTSFPIWVLPFIS